MNKYLVLSVMLLLSVSLVSASSYNTCFYESEDKYITIPIDNGNKVGTSSCECRNWNKQCYWNYKWEWVCNKYCSFAKWSHWEYTISCNSGYEESGNSCVLIKVEPTPTPISEPVKVESHGDGSCVVDWVCENGVAVKEKEFDPLPKSNWTREEKIAHGYKFLDSKYCVALPWKKPNCSVNEMTVVPLEQEPVTEQVQEVERTGWQKFWDWVFGRK
jgi:hypothetical protein